MELETNIPSSLHPLRLIEAQETIYPVQHLGGNDYIQIPYTPQSEVQVQFYDEQNSRIDDLNYTISGGYLTIYINEGYGTLYISLFGVGSQLPENKLELFSLQCVSPDEDFDEYRVAVGKKSFQTYNILLSDIYDWLSSSTGISAQFLPKNRNLAEFAPDTGRNNIALNNIEVYGKRSMESNFLQKTDPNSLNYINESMPSERSSTNIIAVGADFRQKVWPGKVYNYRLAQALNFLSPVNNDEQKAVWPLTSTNAGMDAACTPSSSYGLFKNRDGEYANKVKLVNYYNDGSDQVNGDFYILTVNLHFSDRITLDDSYFTSNPFSDLRIFEFHQMPSWAVGLRGRDMDEPMYSIVDTIDNSGFRSVINVKEGQDTITIYIGKSLRLNTLYKGKAYNEDGEYEMNTNSFNNKLWYEKPGLDNPTREPKSIFDFKSIQTYNISRPNGNYYGDMCSTSNPSQGVNIGNQVQGFNVNYAGTAFRPAGFPFSPQGSTTNNYGAWLCYWYEGNLYHTGVVFRCGPYCNDEPGMNNGWGNNEWWITGEVPLFRYNV